MSNEKIDSVVEALNNLLEDSTIPKNVKIKIQNSINVLKDEKTDVSLKVNKALDELEELGEDVNLEPYTRTQLWNISSMLEMVDN